MTSTMAPAVALPRSGTSYATWEGRTDRTAVDLTRRRKPRGAGLMVAALAIAGTGVVAYDGLARDGSSAFERVAEAPVAASDLSPGSMYHVVDQIGARGLWEQGITGEGVNVAVIDTGIAPVEGLDGDGKVAAIVDLSSEAASPATAFVDGNGHGSHLAGIIAGREDGASPADSAAHPETFLGVAPDAGIVSIKVADRVGDTRPADVIAGVEWAIEHAEELDIGVITLALDTGSTLPYTEDALASAVERAWHAGIVVVTAAGNRGDEGFLASPASNPFVIAVGGTTTDAEPMVAEWSNSGDGVRNPDLVAPGVSIESVRVPGSDADVNHTSGYVDEVTFKGTGSSQSAAVVAGLAALLLDANPTWSPDEVKAALVRSATPVPAASATVAGAGIVDAVAALSADVSDAAQSFERSDVPAPSRPVAAVEEISPGVEWASVYWANADWASVYWASVYWANADWASVYWANADWASVYWASVYWA